VTRARQLRGIPVWSPVLPDGVPGTGAELLAYRKAAGLSLRGLAEKLLKEDGSPYSFQAITWVEQRGRSRPISAGLASAFERAVSGGRLLSPETVATPPDAGPPRPP